MYVKTKLLRKYAQFYGELSINQYAYAVYIYIYIYHFHTSLQREEKVHKCYIALLSVLRNAITRNGGSIYNIYILPLFLVSAFQLVGAFQAMLHWPATNMDVQLPVSLYNATT